MTFRQITDKLTEHYNNAVDFYYKADFCNFFSNIRTAVEYVCRAIIFDALQDEDIANKILEGKKGLSFDSTGKYVIKDFSNDVFQKIVHYYFLQNMHYIISIKMFVLIA